MKIYRYRIGFKRWQFMPSSWYSKNDNLVNHFYWLCFYIAWWRIKEVTNEYHEANKLDFCKTYKIEGGLFTKKKVNNENTSK